MRNSDQKPSGRRTPLYKNLFRGPIESNSQRNRSYRIVKISFLVNTFFLNKNSSDFVQTRCFLWYLFNCNDTFIATLRQNQVESKFLTGNSPLKSSQLIEMISFCIYLNYYR